MAAPRSLCLLLAVLFCVAPVSSHAGQHAWTQDKVSPAINYADDAVAVLYDAAAKQATGKISAVYASRDYHGDARVETSLCWNGTANCVPMSGGSINTKTFNGLDASLPFYLIHKVIGKGSLPSPLFIKGTVTVWFGL